MTRTPEQQWQAMAEEARMGTLSRRRIAVLLEEGFEDLEFWVTVMRLREEQADVTVIADSRRSPASFARRTSRGRSSA